jgi:hypothetical protein
MSIQVDGHRLRYELDLRCMSATVLAKRTGLSDATVGKALASQRIAEESMRLIVAVLENTPVGDFMRKLIGPYAPPRADAEELPSAPTELEA